MIIRCSYHACTRARLRHPARFGPDSPLRGRNTAEEIEEEVRAGIRNGRVGRTSPAGHVLTDYVRKYRYLVWTQDAERVYVVRSSRAKRKRKVVVTCLPAKAEEAVA